MKYTIMIYIGGFWAFLIGLRSVILSKLWDMILLYQSFQKKLFFWIFFIDLIKILIDHWLFSNQSINHL